MIFRVLGPMVRSSTEVHESYNAVFRRCSVLSNKLAPSRDIAVKFAELDRMKHLLSGGYWREGISWVQAGSGVRGLIARKPVLQNHLGWNPVETDNAGKSSRLKFCIINIDNSQIREHFTLFHKKSGHQRKAQRR